MRLRGMDGYAHAGMWTGAQRLAPLLETAVQKGLQKLGDARPRVVVCGHSLGAGVGALLTGLWQDRRPFPGAAVHCLAYACPQVLDPALAAALRPHVTTFIVGDDVVPRLSLATVLDLRDALLCLRTPQAYGVSPPDAPDVLGAIGRGDVDAAQLYRAVREGACRAAGRLCPAGRLIALAPGAAVPREVGPDHVAELRVSGDMLAAHMLFRHLEALEAARGAMTP